MQSPAIDPAVFSEEAGSYLVVRNTVTLLTMHSDLLIMVEMFKFARHIADAPPLKAILTGEIDGCVLRLSIKY